MLQINKNRSKLLFRSLSQYFLFLAKCLTNNNDLLFGTMCQAVYYISTPIILLRSSALFALTYLKEISLRLKLYTKEYQN